MFSQSKVAEAVTIKRDMATQKPDIKTRIITLARNNVWTVFVALGVVAFIQILNHLFSAQVTRLDELAYNLLVVRLRSTWLTPTMEGLSTLASPVGLLAMLIMVGAFAPGKRPGWCAATNLVLVVILNTLLKNVIQRPRPDGFRLVSEVGYSFPSGHSMVAMAFYGFLAWLVWRYEHEELIRWFYTLIFSLLILAVGISRIYLGVHYASDVIAGFFVALAWLAFYTKVIAPLFLPDSRHFSLDAPHETPVVVYEPEEHGR